MSFRNLGAGLHYGIPAKDYHADPCEDVSLSSGVLRTLLGKSIEHAALEHPRIGAGSKDSTSSMNLGSIVHSLLAGDESDLILGPFKDYKCASAREWRDNAIAAGRTPVLERDLQEARPIELAIRDKVALGCTNNPFSPIGRSEVTAVWKEGDAFCRARYDRLVVDPQGYADIWDWKTTTDVSPEAIARTIAEYGYHIQAAFYLRGLATNLPKYLGRTSFIFGFVETCAPYSVRRVTLSPSFLAIGARQVNEGIVRWKNALAARDFSAPNAETLEVEPPAYLETDDEITIS